MQYLKGLLIAAAVVIGAGSGCATLKAAFFSDECEVARDSIGDYVKGDLADQEDAVKAQITACLESVAANLLDDLRDALLAAIGGAFGGILAHSEDSEARHALNARASALSQYVFSEYERLKVSH